MVNVYIRRRKKILFIYARRRRGFKEQEPSVLPCCDGISSLNEEVQNNGVFSSVNEGFLEPSISLKNQLDEILPVRENSEGAKGEILDNFFLSIGSSFHEDENKAKKPIGIGSINNESLLSMIQQLPSTLCFQRKPRSARKPTLFDSRRRFPALIDNESLLSVVEQVSSTGWFPRRHRSGKKSTTLASRRESIIEVSSSDTTEQMAAHLGTSTSVCCEINPKTPIKEDRKSKCTSHSLCDVRGLLSTGFLEGSLVTYRKNNFELQGVLGTTGIYCGCSICNFEQVASSLKFEKHAGSQSHNQNAHIFLENGKSLYALSKELKNVPLGTLSEVMEGKLGYSANKAVYKDWKDNPMMHHNNGGSQNQKHYPDLLYDHRASLNFPKGRRSTRPVRPLKVISKVNQVSRQLIFSDTDLQRHPAHKKRGVESVDIKSSKDLYLKESSEITSKDLCKSKIVDISEKSKLSYTVICKKNGKLSSNYNIDRPFSTISRLLTIRLLEIMLVNYKKDKIEFLRCIKDLGISCGYSWHRLNKVLSSLNLEKHGGTSNMNQKDCFFISKKLALYALVKEVGRVPLGLMTGELMQKIGFQLNNIRFLPWKGSFHKNKINLPTTSCDDGKNQSPHFLHHGRPPAERLMLPLPASENNLPLPRVNDAKVNFSRQSKKTKKQRDQDFHQLIFELLDDGTKLCYYSHGKEILEGYKFGKNIICRCCNSMFSASKFEAHAGHGKRRKPYHSIYTYGKSLHHIAMILLPDKSSFDPIKKDLIMAGKAGENMTVALRYHNAYNAGERSSSACNPFNFQFGRVFQAPSNTCSCMFCENGDATLNFGNICDTTMLFCGQCGRMFHVGCLRIHGICDIKERPKPSDSWLCGDKCIEVHANLLNFVQEGPRTIPNSIMTSLLSSTRSTSNKEAQIDFHWQLLSGRFHGDKSKFLLQQATIIFQEAFGVVYKGYRDVLSTMIHGEKGVAEFFQGMFCVVLIEKSTIMSAALLRVFGNHVAELPLAATTKERRREGFFKILFLRIVDMLSFMKVENLILPADDHSLPMWSEKFGFINLSTEEIREYQMNHRMVMFENATMLKRPILPSTLDFA